MNDLWETRTLSLRALVTDFSLEGEIIARSFDLVDKTIARFEEVRKYVSNAENPFFYFCGCALAKGRRLCLGKYGLGLDGLSWEAGALSRTLLEVIEKLHWLKDDPSRVRNLVGGKSPRSGKVARSVGSPFQDARSHLSEMASHFALSPEVVNMLTDSTTGHLRATARFNRTELYETLRGLFTEILQLLIAAVGCLAIGGEPNHDLADELESLRGDGFKAFKVVAIAGFGIPQDIPAEEKMNYKYPLEVPILRFPPVPNDDTDEGE
jgi:hypothetical protein